MFENEILTQGQKIRKLREEKNITQKQLAEKVGRTRNAISMIETDSLELCEDLCEEISKAFVQLIESNEITEEHIYEYLHETREYQIFKFLESFKNEVKIKIIAKKDIKNKIDELNSFVINNDLQRINNEQICECLSDIFKSLRKIDESRFYLNRWLQLSKSVESELKCYHKLILLELKVSNCQGVYLFNKLSHRLKTKDKYSQILKKIDFNTAKAFRKDAKFEECIKQLEYIKENYILENNEYIYLLNLQGKCLFKLKDYSKAEEILLLAFKIITETESEATLCTIAQNLILLYIEIGNLNEANKFRDIALSTSTKSSNSVDRVRELYYMLLIEIKLDNFKYVSESYITVLNEAINIDDYNVQVNVLRQTINYFINRNEKNSLNIILSIIEQKLNKNELQYREIADFFIIASDYFYNVDNEKYFKYFNTSIKIIKNFESKKDFEI